MAIPSRPIADILRYNGSFKYLDQLIEVLSELARRTTWPTYLNHEGSDTKTKVEEIIKDLRAAKANIQTPKIAVSRLHKTQVDRITKLAECLLTQQIAFEAARRSGSAPKESPFGTRIVSLQWLQELAVAKEDTPSTTIADLALKYKKIIEQMLNEIRDDQGNYKAHIDDPLQDFLVDFDLTNAAFIAKPLFLRFLVSAPQKYEELYNALDKKEKELLSKEMKKNNIKSPLIKETVSDLLWFPATAIKAALVSAMLLSFVPYTRFEIPLVPNLHSWTIYACIGSLYTAGHYVLISTTDAASLVARIKRWANQKLQPAKWCYEKVKICATAAIEVKNVTVSLVKETPLIGRAISGSKWAQVALVTLVAKYLFGLSSSSYANFLPDEATLTEIYKSFVKTVSALCSTTIVLPDLLFSGFKIVSPFINPTTIVAFVATNYIYGDEIDAVKAKVAKIAKKTLAFTKWLIPNPKPLFVHPFKAVASLCPSFISSRLGFGSAKKIFTTPLARGKLPHTCQLLNDPKYSPTVQKAARFAQAAITPVAIFMGAFQDLVEKNISHPEESRAAIARYCQAKKWSVTSVESFAAAFSSGEAVLNWGAKIPGLNIVMGQLRTQVGMVTAVGSTAIGLGMMVVGNQTTREAGAAIIREFTVQGAANALRGLVESYLYLLSLVLTIPWDFSGHRLCIVGEREPSPLHPSLATRHIADEMLSKAV